jgi:hypothetical protein
MDYLKIRNKTEQFPLITGLSVHEFDELLETFTEKWDSYHKYHRMDGSIRTNKAYISRKSQIPTAGHKLFFILYYLRNHPTQTALAASFGMEQYQANQWIHRLTTILNDSLSSLKLLPARNIRELQRLINESKIEKILLDATEREVYRSVDYETQHEYYSGKKKDIQSKIM